jgi:DNA polymerase III epsilon subunit-like protein
VSARICFADTETTSLRPDRRAWEIGIILREQDGTETEHHWFIDADDLDLGNADPASLKIGRFYERHPQATRHWVSGLPQASREKAVLLEVEEITRGAHLVGAVVSFDADVLGQRMRANGICPSWNYHLIDVEALAAGWLHRHAAVLENSQHSLEEADRLRVLASPPWKSDDLSAALGVTVSEEDRHTALGDARFARAIYDAVVAR